MPIATELGRVVTYHESLLLIKSHDPFITWSCEIKLQTKNIIPPLPGYLWPPNLAGWGSCPLSHKTLITWSYNIT